MPRWRADGAVVATRSRCELVPIAANLRIGALEEAFNPEALAAGPIAHEFGAELKFLWEFAQHLQSARGKADVEGEIQRAEYNFYVEGERVRIVERKRGSPIDKVVSELMILQTPNGAASSRVPGTWRSTARKAAGSPA